MSCRGTAAKRPVNPLEQLIDLVPRVPAHDQRKGPHEMTITSSERLRLSAAQALTCDNLVGSSPDDRRRSHLSASS
jgi:hypothetical protein